MNKNSVVYVAGHRSMVGSAILRRLKSDGYTNIIARDRAELDLLDQSAVESFFKAERPEVVFLAAARVGGIMANMTNQAAFLYENLQIQNNVIHSAAEYGTKKFIFLGSSCIYPRDCRQPMKEEYLLTAPLEPTNEGYAIAKIAGLKLLQYLNKEKGFDSLSVIPCNLYGQGDHFDLVNGHVVASLVKRFVDAAESNTPEITLWGTGKAFREIMDVDEMVDAMFFVMEKDVPKNYINIGTGSDLSIKELAETIADIVSYKGDIKWDTSRPDGMPRKCLDTSRLNSIGWHPSKPLRESLLNMVKNYTASKE